MICLVFHQRILAPEVSKVVVHLACAQDCCALHDGPTMVANERAVASTWLMRGSQENKESQCLHTFSWKLIWQHSKWQSLALSSPWRIQLKSKILFSKSWFLEDFQFSFTESNQRVKPALFVAERTSPSAVVSCSVLRTDRRATILH